MSRAGDTQDPQAPTALATDQILSHLTTFLRAYADDPDEAVLYLVAPGLPGRHIFVDRLESGFGLALCRGFPRSCVKTEFPNSVGWLDEHGYEEHEGVWARKSSLALDAAAKEILTVFQSAWGPADGEAPTVLTASRQVFEASRSVGQLALAPPGTPDDRSPDFPSPTRESLEIAFIGGWLFQGESYDGVVCFLGPPTLCLENLELYVRLTFGTASAVSLYSLPNGGFYHAGWGFNAKANPDLIHLFPERTIHPDNSLEISADYYSWPDQSWTPLLFHPDMPLYSYAGKAQPIFSDHITFLPPIFSAKGQLFINSARPLSLSNKWSPFLQNGPFRNTENGRPVERYSLAVQAPELLTWPAMFRERARAWTAIEEKRRADVDRDKS